MESRLVETGAVSPDAMASRLMQRAHNLDGLPEILIAIVLFVGSGTNWASVLFEAHSVGRTVMKLSCIALFTVVCLAGSPLVQWARRRWLLDRVGYVKTKPNRKGMALALGLAVAVACAAVLLMLKMRAQIADRWVLLAIGASFCIFEIVAGKLPRFYVSGMLALGAAAGLTWAGLGLELSVALLLDFVAVLALANGCVALVRLLRQPIESELS